MLFGLLVHFITWSRLPPIHACWLVDLTIHASSPIHASSSNFPDHATHKICAIHASSFLPVYAYLFTSLTLFSCSRQCSQHFYSRLFSSFSIHASLFFLYLITHLFLNYLITPLFLNYLITPLSLPFTWSHLRCMLFTPILITPINACCSHLLSTKCFSRLLNCHYLFTPYFFHNNWSHFLFINTENNTLCTLNLYLLLL